MQAVVMVGGMVELAELEVGLAELEVGMVRVEMGMVEARALAVADLGVGLADLGVVGLGVVVEAHTADHCTAASHQID